MKRSTPLRRTPFNAPAKASTKVSQSKCKVCRAPFVKFDMRVKWCSPECGLVIAQAEIAKKAQRAAKDDRKHTKAQLEALKTRSDYMKEAQREFNRYIRLRDKGKPCICCGLPLSAGSVGGEYDCGHYRSVGSAPHLRFDERNAHGQRKQCNRYGAGRAVDYRLGLISRIGQDAVDDLEAVQGLAKFSAQDLIAIRDTYRLKAKELEKE